jgi:prefoldin subunit 5
MIRSIEKIIKEIETLQAEYNDLEKMIKNDRKEGLIPWGAEIAQIHINEKIKNLKNELVQIYLKSSIEESL